MASAMRAKGIADQLTILPVLGTLGTSAVLSQMSANELQKIFILGAETHATARIFNKGYACTLANAALDHNPLALDELLEGTMASGSSAMALNIFLPSKWFGIVDKAIKTVQYVNAASKIVEKSRQWELLNRQIESGLRDHSLSEEQARALKILASKAGIEDEGPGASEIPKPHQ